MPYDVAIGDVPISHLGGSLGLHSARWGGLIEGMLMHLMGFVMVLVLRSM